MSHEPECSANRSQPVPTVRCICTSLRAAYQRGYDEAATKWAERERYNTNIGYRSGYRQGYNDHAASRAHAEAIYGRYNPDDPSCTGREPHMCGWNQHGKGLENP